MANLVKLIKNKIKVREIEAIVIGEMGWSDGYGSEDVPNYDRQPKKTILTWKEAKKWLDYDFNDGFGAPGCNAIYVWTPDEVLFISTYDGATSLESIPRNPAKMMPIMYGGG
jgi:hypothetical protein